MLDAILLDTFCTIDEHKDTAEESEFEIEENGQTEISLDSNKTEHFQELNFFNNWDDSESSSSSNKKGSYLTPEENGGLEGNFKPEVADLKDKKGKVKTINYEKINLSKLHKAKKQYSDVKELTSTMAELVAADYASNAKSMEKLKIKKNMIIEFVNEYCNENKKETFWSTQIAVNPEFIDKSSNGAYSNGYINQVDKAKVTVCGTKIEFVCKILHIFPLTNTIEIIMKLTSKERANYQKMKCFKFGVSPEGSKTVKFTASAISFIPSDIIFKRRMKALNVISQEVNSEPIMNILLGKEPAPESGECTADLSDISLTENQLSVVKKATTNKVSIIQGPPGTGKTHVISAIAYSILQQYPNERILLCGTSNQSVENMVSAAAKLIENAGKKFVWLGSQRTDFAIDGNITEEQEYLIFNKIMNRDSFEGREFQDLQEELLHRSLTRQETIRINILRKKLEENISYESDVVCCTLETAGKKSLDKLKFATVIIDEATQALEPSSFIPLMHHAERLILVGDQKQLGPSIPRDDSFKNLNYGVSLFERSVENQYPILFLDTQFRMHPDISRFSNECFYNNMINNAITAEQRELTTNVIKDHVSFIETKGEEEKVGTSFKNDAEITEVCSMVSKLVNNNVSMDEIGVIAPYAAQVKELRKCITEAYPDVKVGSVDSFQGSQKNYIIISTVRSGNTLGFLSDARRLNVSMTRARIAVIVIGKSKSLNNDPYWKKLVSYCKNELKSYYKGDNSKPKKEKKQKKVAAQEKASKNPSENQEEKKNAKRSKKNKNKTQKTKPLKQ